MLCVNGNNCFKKQPTVHTTVADEYTRLGQYSLLIQVQQQFPNNLEQINQLKEILGYITMNKHY
jgi:hypothetical protein